jgi:hypothetical protein
MVPENCRIRWNYPALRIAKIIVQLNLYHSLLKGSERDHCFCESGLFEWIRRHCSSGRGRYRKWSGKRNEYKVKVPISLWILPNGAVILYEGTNLALNPDSFIGLFSRTKYDLSMWANQTSTWRNIFYKYYRWFGGKVGTNSRETTSVSRGKNIVWNSYITCFIGYQHSWKLQL